MDNSYVQKLVGLNLKFIADEIVPLIKNDYAQVAVKEVLERLDATVIAVTDENPQNKEQLAVIWGSVTSDPDVIENVRKGLLEVVAKIDEPILQQGLSLAVGPLVQTLVLLSDKNKDNNKEVKQVWVTFVESPEFLAFVISNLEWVIRKIVKNDKIEDLIVNLLKAFTK